MNYILFDGASRDRLLPFTYTRPVAEIRIGILTIKEKWEKMLGVTVTYLTEEYLQDKFPIVEFEENVYIDASVIPNEKLIEEIQFLSKNQAVVFKDQVIVFYASQFQDEVDFDDYELIEFENEVVKIEKSIDIFSKNAKVIVSDYNLLTQDRISETISGTNQILGIENVFIEKGAVVEFVTINAIEGPVYIGKDALVMEGSMLRGPISIGKNSVVKMGTKIYGGTTVGPKCTVGGEIKNVVFFGYSNKGHEGYLGNSVIGELCNFGANTNCSNMKNNHSTVKVWDYEECGFVDSNRQFCGLFLGDYSKLGINTMLNTGTVVGISTSIFGAGFPPKFIPSFSWGVVNSKTTYILEKSINDAKKMCAFKNIELDEKEIEILKEVFEISRNFRQEF
ncbi:GlmU family protein [Flavicella sp.]|uniref:GlmU family protein n=1 Tax=Flavicella sp. TaxID=2957742 RepID=UPI00301A922F